MQEDFSHFGINLTYLYINSLTPPVEVQQAVDDRSRMRVFDGLNKLMQMKAAMAMEKASEANGGAGAGMGLRMPAMFAQYFAGTLPQSEQTEGQPVFNCLDCKNPIAADVNFRPQCGHLRIVYNQCTKCAKNMTPNAKLCSRCGTAVEEMTRTKPCPICGNENLADSMYCIETAISDENIFS